MAKVNFNVWENKSEAVKEFTDREEPQEAFERKFKALSDDWKTDYYVLSYYGIGGIGKTSFVNKLRKVIRGVEKTCWLDEIDCDYIEYSFDAINSTFDKEVILTSFRNQLGKINKDFIFFRFDYAMYLYTQNIGKTIEKEEKKSLLETPPWLKTFSPLLEYIPGVSPVANLIKMIDSLTVNLKEYVDKKRFREDLLEMSELESSEILEQLHEFFCLDMQYNMQHFAKKPIVVFLDTYEKYIDTLNKSKNMIIDDYWLHKGCKSVIRSIPGLLWVITGREKLYWGDGWKELVVNSPLSEITEEEKERNAKTELEQHLMGDLSEQDAIRFLSRAGIRDENLCRQLYQLTNGTPLFLDMCVETYIELNENEINPDIEMFGKDLDQLISRYLCNMSESNCEMMSFLACLGKWNDELVKQIASEATLLRNYTYTKYKAFVEHPFIIMHTDGSYCMHETVKIASLKNADEELVNEINELHLIMAKKNLKECSDIQINIALTEYVRILEKKKSSYDELCENVKLICKYLNYIHNIGKYDLVYNIANKMFFIVNKSYPNTYAEYIIRSYYGNALAEKGLVKEALEIIEVIPLFYNDIEGNVNEWLSMLAMISNVYFCNGMYKESMEIETVILEENKMMGDEHHDTLTSMNNLGYQYFKLGNYERAQKILEVVYEKRKEILGDEHLDTLVTKNCLGVLYINLGNYEHSMELLKAVYEKRKEVLGDEHPNTLTAMNNLALVYAKLGDYENSIKLYNDVYEKNRKILGDKHPDTFLVMNNLADVYRQSSDYENSLELFNDVYENSREILGDEHPFTLTVMNNLAFVYAKLGDYENSLELYNDVYEKSRVILGDEHPDTLNVMNNLAHVYGELIEILGDEHPDTLTVMNNLAFVYAKLGDYENAINLLKDVCEKSKKILGDEHPDTLASMYNLMVVYRDSGYYGEAIEIEERLAQINEKNF